MTTDCKLLRRSAVEEKVGLKCSAIYSRLDPKSESYDPDFPRPIRLGKGVRPPIAWLQAEVDAWIERQVELSRSAA